MKILYRIILIIILFFPKINIINLPGTYVGIRIEDILVVTFIIVYLIKENKRLKILFENKKIVEIILLFSIYILLCLTSTIKGIINQNVQILLSFLFLIRKIEYFMFFFLGYGMIKEEKSTDFIFRMINLSVIIHCGIAILQKYGVLGEFINGSYIINQDRVFSTFNGPYEFATYFTLTLPIYILKLIKSKNNIKLIIKYIIFILIIMIGIFLSQSRTSLVIAIFLLVLLSIIESNTLILNFAKRKKLQFIIFMIIILILTFIISSFILKTERFKTLDISSIINTIRISWENKDFERYQKEGFYITGEEETDLSFKIRINKWMALIDGIRECPILGLGVSITKEACDGNYIRILAESGIVGLVSWIVIIISILKNTKDRDCDIVFLARYDIIVLLLTALFIDIFEASKIMMFYWLILGIIYSNDKKEIENSEK